MPRHWASLISVMAIGCIVLGAPAPASSLTVQFDRDQPGVREFVAAFMAFPVNGTDLLVRLPPTFYMIMTRTEQDAVIVAKIGEVSRHPGLVPLLADLSGPQRKTTKGPHGATVIFHPAGDGKHLSAYAVWGEWLLVAAKRDALEALMIRVGHPKAIVAPAKTFSSESLKGRGGIRFWGDNATGGLAALLKESQQKVLVPLIKDPVQIGRLSGVIQIGPGRTLTGRVAVVPSMPQHLTALRGDLKFLLETARRRLTALGVRYQGSLVESRAGLTMKITIGDYTKAQPGLITLQP